MASFLIQPDADSNCCGCDVKTSPCDPCEIAAPCGTCPSWTVECDSRTYQSTDPIPPYSNSWAACTLPTCLCCVATTTGLPGVATVTDFRLRIYLPGGPVNCRLRFRLVYWRVNLCSDNVPIGESSADAIIEAGQVYSDIHFADHWEFGNQTWYVHSVTCHPDTPLPTHVTGTIALSCSTCSTGYTWAIDNDLTVLVGDSTCQRQLGTTAHPTCSCNFGNPCLFVGGFSIHLNALCQWIMNTNISIGNDSTVICGAVETGRVVNLSTLPAVVSFVLTGFSGDSATISLTFS